MFDALGEKLQATLSDLRAHGTLTEEDIDRAMREIRLALLEADVNFKVVKTFTATVKERCLGSDVVGGLNPGQQVVKIVSDELTSLMGGATAGVTFSPRPPTVILLAGLQGSGKTTAAAKLARFLKEEHGSSVALAACDVYRPAAVEQLITMGERAGGEVYSQGTDADPVDIAAWALEQAKTAGKDVLIVDTAGRLHTHDNLMEELVKVRRVASKRLEGAPHETLIVIDSTTGQNGLRQARAFADAVDVTGVVLTKLDGTAKGGIALAIAGELGIPVKMIGVGEGIEDLRPFDAEAFAHALLDE